MKSFSCWAIGLLLLISGCLAPTDPQPPAPQLRPLPAGSEDEFFTGNRRQFTFHGCRAWVAEPASPLAGKPWCWFFAEEADITPEVSVAQLLERGITCAFLDTDNEEIQADFYQLLREAGFAERVILAGIGGKADAAYRFAGRNPERISLIYGDSPDCRFLTDAPEILPALVAAKVPIIHLVGTADEITPPERNSYLVEVTVRQLGGTMEVVRKNGSGHRPYGLPHPGIVARYILKHRR